MCHLFSVQKGFMYKLYNFCNMLRKKGHYHRKNIKQGKYIYCAYVQCINYIICYLHTPPIQSIQFMWFSQFSKRQHNQVGSKINTGEPVFTSLTLLIQTWRNSTSLLYNQFIQGYVFTCRSGQIIPVQWSAQTWLYGLRLCKCPRQRGCSWCL